MVCDHAEKQRKGEVSDFALTFYIYTIPYPGNGIMTVFTY